MVVRAQLFKLITSQQTHAAAYSLFPEEIAIIESTIDRNTPAGIRNYAIILLVSLWHPACDVASLTFENIDFANNRLHFIQQKTGAPWEGELLPEVKSAFQDYIENVRPDIGGCSKVFLTLMIPYKPVDSGAINTMVGAAFQNAEVDIAGRRHGSRAFRSSIASNLVNDSVSTEIVRRVLGHGTRYALKHYARIDIESMRLCPLSVPEPSGTFAELLSWNAGETHV